MIFESYYHTCLSSGMTGQTESAVRILPGDGLGHSEGEHRSPAGAARDDGTQNQAHSEQSRK